MSRKIQSTSRKPRIAIVGATGRVDLTEQNIDVRLLVKPNAPSDRPLKAADLEDAETIVLRGPWQAPYVRGENAAVP